MSQLLGSSIDSKNIELAKILLSLRHDLDVHCLICANASKINEASPGRFFLPHVSMRVLESIVLAICKVYEDEKKNYELNSVQGVLNSLSRRIPAPILDEPSVRGFVTHYAGPTEEADLLMALQATFEQFKAKHGAELREFKTARDKLIAHSEYKAIVESVPSFDMMEKLFGFGADFYRAVSFSFVGCVPENLKDRREIKRDFAKVLITIGIRDVKTEMT